MRTRSLPPLMLAAALLAGAAGLALPTGARASTYISVQIGPPPAPVEVVPAARPGYVWAPGFYERRAERYHWRPGHWERARPGHVYVPARWHAVGPRWEHRPAYWQASKQARKHLRKAEKHREAARRHERKAWNQSRKAYYEAPARPLARPAQQPGWERVRY